MSQVRIGTSGWNYPAWRGVLYERGLPQRAWLERYAETFDTVELNASFYRLPKVEQFSSWKRRTPARFAFAVKGSRLITHYKRLVDVGPDVETFLSRVRGLGRKAPVLLWQLPPGLERDDLLFARFLDLLPGGKTRRQAVEFRNRSWYAPDVYRALERRGVALVLPDSAARESMNAPELRHTASFAYVRLHYGGGRRGDYTDRQLRTWAERISDWRRRGDVYVYFNNDWEGFAVRNAVRLKELVGAGAPRRGR
ncbi:MAG: DUF72 domain-containing protein [Acidobacteriota bacterium]